jgi:hypothetical protein
VENMTEKIINNREHPLEIKNVGEDNYILMSKGHHCPHEFMRAVRSDGYEWPLGMPEHKWIRAIPAPKNSGYSCLYVEAIPESRGAFPATYAYEAYGDERYETLIAGQSLRKNVENHLKSVDKPAVCPCALKS